MLLDHPLLLRALCEKDLAALIRLANNKKIWDNLRNYFPHPYTQLDADQFLEKLIQEEPKLTFAIDHQNQFCGIIGLNKQSDVYEKSLEMGYWLGEEYWNMGIASKAVKLITQYATQELGFERIFTSVYAYNKASMRVLEKNNYILEGVFRKAVYKNENYVDEFRYAFVI